MADKRLWLHVLLLLLLLCCQVKLIDLGMAGLYRPKQPMQGCMGSPGFIAPEVILGEAHTVSHLYHSVFLVLALQYVALLTLHGVAVTPGCIMGTTLLQ